MSIKGFVKKSFGEIMEIIAAAGGGAITHWFITETLTDGKRVFKGLDMDKIRGEAPHFARRLEDEAEFNGLVTQLDPGLQKSLEVWMANLGTQQRADVILTVVEMLVRRKMPDDLVQARKEAVTVLEQLAAVTPDVFKTRRAVAFRLMKANESDYLGARITGQGAEAFAALLEDLTALRDWMDFDATTAEVSANNILVEVKDRNNENIFSKIFHGFTRSLSI